MITKNLPPSAKKSDHPTTAIYIRVSTRSQSTERQLNDLLKVCGPNTRIFNETASGTKSRRDRPILDELLTLITQRKIQRLAVWSVDRLGRSMTDLCHTLETIKSSDASLYIHSQGLDTDTSSGKMMFNLLSVFSEFERETTIERIKSGLDRARSSGKRLGRPPTKQSLIDRILKLYADGKTQTEISKTVNRSQARISQILKGHLPGRRSTRPTS